MQKLLDETPLSIGGTEAIAFKGVSRLYGNVIAVNNVDLSIEQGTLFRSLGLRGAARPHRCA
jgi:ABC-type uncharacterized transport system ATPase subunit